MASVVASTSSYVFPDSDSPTSPRFPTRSTSRHRPDPVYRSDASQSESESDQDDSDEYIERPQRPARGRNSDEGERQPRKRARNLFCSYEGCNRVFSRQARLEEHERTHTGERPFECPECAATFTRISHLKAHVRSHASESDKNYPCPEASCDQAFWTNQHLKKHIEVVHHGKTYNCTQCDGKFRKHHQLRAHFAEVHCTPGTKPFLCDHPGCERSFSQKVHLKAHAKTHDPSRYVCLHPACASLPLSQRQFPLWSHLQKHTKIAHPPTCPHPECRGKTFTTTRGLKNHLLIHEREAEKGEEGKDFADPTQRSNVKRKRSERRKKKERREQEQQVVVKTEDEENDLEGNSTQGLDEDEEGSDWERRQENERDQRMRDDFRLGGKKKRRVYEDSNGLTRMPERVSASHQVQADPFPIPAPFGVDQTVDNPFPLPPPHRIISDATVSAPSQVPTASQYLDSLTGSNYAAPSRAAAESKSAAPSKRELVRKFPCPFPAILGLPFKSVEYKPSTPSRSRGSSPGGPLEDAVAGYDDDNDEGLCSFWFKRIYDVERHLRSRHGVEMVDSKSTLKTWYEELEKQP